MIFVNGHPLGDLFWSSFIILSLGGGGQRIRKRPRGAWGGWGRLVVWSSSSRLPAADGATTWPHHTQLLGIQRLQRRLLSRGIRRREEQNKCKQARVSQKNRFHFVFLTYHYLNLLPEIKYMIFMTMLKPKGYRFNCPNKENIISVLYIFKRKLLHKHMKDAGCGWNIFQIASLSNMEELWHRMNVWFHNKEQMIFTEQILG